MKDNYKIYDYAKEENKNYSWYEDVINNKKPRYKMDKPRPYNDADYYYAMSYDKNVWDIHFKGKSIGLEVQGIEKINEILIYYNQDIPSRMIYN